ncbi:MAG: acetyl-CoA hydrolase, partial [Pseudoxanthomonas sp.]
LQAVLAPFRKDGTLPDYPLGSDFTEVEQRLVKALGWLKAETATLPGKLKLVFRALASNAPHDTDALQRMGLEKPSGVAEWIEARLVRYALRHASA